MVYSIWAYSVVIVSFLFFIYLYGAIVVYYKYKNQLKQKVLESYGDQKFEDVWEVTWKTTKIPMLFMYCTKSWYMLLLDTRDKYFPKKQEEKP